jgi:dienelactone hydrolase
MQQMARRSNRLFLFAPRAALVTLAIIGQSGVVAAQERLPVVVRVEKTHNNAPFDYRIESRVQRPNYVVYRFTYPSPLVTQIPQNNTIPAAYYLPKGTKPTDPKRPAVICMHILDGNEELMRMTCSTLASHGIPAIAFKLPYYGERGPAEGPKVMADNPKLLLDALAQGLADIRRTVDLLAARPEIDPERIGIMGISLGGITAGTAAGVEPRLHRTMMILAGGDVQTIIHHARETRDLSRLIRELPAGDRAQVERIIVEVDPLRHAADLRPRAVQGKVLMVNAAEDEVIPRACTEKLADALGIREKVRWLDGLGHYTAIAALPQVLDQMVQFFSEDLDPSLRIKPEPSAVKTPVEVVLRLVQQALGFLTVEPGRGRCHFAELTASVTPKGQKPLEGRLLMARGAEGKFKIECKLPVVGEVALGQGKYPWMASAKKLFKGVKDPPAKPGDPLAFANPAGMTRIQVMAGAVAGALFAPEILDSLVTVAEDRTADGKRTIRLTLKGRNRGALALALREDGRTPQRVSFDVPGAAGMIQFRQWQIGTIAPDGVFDPPSGLPEQEVDATEMHRVFSAMFNFAMENVQ